MVHILIMFFLPTLTKLSQRFDKNSGMLKTEAERVLTRFRDGF